MAGQNVNVRMDPELVAYVEAVAKDRRVSVSDVVRAAILDQMRREQKTKAR